MYDRVGGLLSVVLSGLLLGVSLYVAVNPQMHVVHILYLSLSLIATFCHKSTYLLHASVDLALFMPICCKLTLSLFFSGA